MDHTHVAARPRLEKTGIPNSIMTIGSIPGASRSGSH